MDARYTKQNAKALEEAKTALETGEVKTPSEGSKWTSEGGGSDEQEEIDGSTCGIKSTACSSGEEYQPRSSRSNSTVSLNDSEEEYQSDSASEGSGTEITEDEYRTSDDSSDPEESWEPADKSTTPDTSSENDYSEVCNFHHNRLCS